MSNEELERFIASMDKHQAEVASSPAKARAFLVRAGIVTPDGKLTEAYRQDA